MGMNGGKETEQIIVILNHGLRWSDGPARKGRKLVEALKSCSITASQSAPLLA